MTKLYCPSCGAVYNGKKCRACCYEHFSQEIPRGPGVCKREPPVMERTGPRRKSRDRHRRKHPMLRFLVLLITIYSLLPSIANWGLELERREAEAMPEGLVTLYEQQDITILIQPEQLTDFTRELRLWVKNNTGKDVSAISHYVVVNGFVLPNSTFYSQPVPEGYSMSTLYLKQWDLEDAGITDVQELTFCLDIREGNTLLFTTEPITLSKTGRPVNQETDLGGTLLLEQEGLRIHDLGYFPDEKQPKYEKGSRKFYIENKTDSHLCLNALKTTVSGEAAELYLFAELPSGTRTVATMELWGLAALDWDTPSQLGDLEMTLTLWDPTVENSPVKTFSVTIPMVNP